MKHVTVVEERGATATNPKMMPRQHIGFGYSFEMPVQKEMCGCVQKTVGCSRILGVPRVGGMAKERPRNEQPQTVQTRGSSHTSHNIRSRKVFSGLYLPREHSRAVRVVEEVVVLVAVVVLG